MLFCVLSGAAPTASACAAWCFVAARAAYAVCYYLDLGTFRSVALGVSLLALAVLVGIGFPS